MEFEHQINKRMRRMLLAVGLIFGCVFLYKGFMHLMLKMYLASNQSPIVEVSTMQVNYAPWQPEMSAIGSVRAIQGVDVTTEIPGMVKAIYFTPGTFVRKNTVLVELNADSDIALLHSLEANAELAKVTYLRDKAQYAVKAVSKQTLDTDTATLKNLQAQVAQQVAIVLKKTIRAPFDGRLGISQINAGQFLNPGDTIVTLQTLNPVYVDFFLPQQKLAQLRIGEKITVKSDAFPKTTFVGKITTINPAIDQSTRNVQVEATVNNPHQELVPGMFVHLTVSTGNASSFLTLPQAAISFNPYGELVFIVREAGKTWRGKHILKAYQAFVVAGDKRGDQVAILKGLKEGDRVVTSGQLKLRNGSEVVISDDINATNSSHLTTADNN